MLVYVCACVWPSVRVCVWVSGTSYVAFSDYSFTDTPGGVFLSATKDTFSEREHIPWTPYVKPYWHEDTSKAVLAAVTGTGAAWPSGYGKGSIYSDIEAMFHWHEAEDLVESDLCKRFGTFEGNYVAGEYRKSWFSVISDAVRFFS